MNLMLVISAIALLPLSLCSTVHPKHEFTMEYYYSLRIGQKQDVNVLLDTSQSESVLFKDADRPYFPFIDTSKHEQAHTIEINGLLLKDFEFELEKDKTLLDNKECQGILGLGIEDGENDLMDELYEKGVIDKKVLFFTTHPVPKIQFQDDIRKDLVRNFTKCSLSNKDDLDHDDFDDFEEGWLCDLTHLYPENATDLNTSIEVKGRALFDAKSYYMTAPMDYFELFMDYFTPDKADNDTQNDCTSFVLQGDSYLSCNFTQEYFNSMDNMSFVLGGYAYNLDSRKLFTAMGDTKYQSLIRFRNSTKNLWVFGFPFFSSYVLEFDYDNQTVGFLGDLPENLTADWAVWVELNTPEKSLVDSILANKTIMIIGIVSLSLIILIVISVLIYQCVKKGKKDGMKPLKEEVEQKA